MNSLEAKFEETKGVPCNQSRKLNKDRQTMAKRQKDKQRSTGP